MAAILLTGLVVTAPPAPAVVGGSTVPTGLYPFMASVQHNNAHFCGGSVIASTWVLTAAHCVSNGSAAGLSVVVGTNNNRNGSGTRIGVGRVLVHPLYGTNSVFDAALLQLNSAVPGGVQAIKLANAPADDGLEVNGATVTVAGWGDNNPVTLGLLAGPNLMQARLNIVGDQQCMGSTTTTEAITTVCAAALLKDSCQGDSGGPLFAALGNSWTQVGVVSRGLLCAIPTQPGMYSEVNNSDIRSFIFNNTGA